MKSSVNTAFHAVLIVLNVPTVLIVLYVFAYAFGGLWSPAAAAWWWLAVLALPTTIAILATARFFWKAGAHIRSNLVALIPPLACSPIFVWIFHVISTA